MGGGGGGERGGRGRRGEVKMKVCLVSNLVLYAQSTSAKVCLGANGN